MRNTKWILAGLILGCVSGATAASHALSCLAASATVVLELSEVTVDGQVAPMETVPDTVSMAYAGRDPETDSLLDRHALLVTAEGATYPSWLYLDANP